MSVLVVGAIAAVQLFTGDHWEESLPPLLRVEAEEPADAPVEEPAAPEPWSASDRFGNLKKRFGVTTAYGWGIGVGPGRDSELKDIEMLRFSADFGVGMGKEVFKDSWAQGSFEMDFELNYIHNFQPNQGKAFGLDVLIRYNFLSDDRWVPFVEAGCGGMNLDFDLEDQDDGFNFVPQAGVGTHYFFAEDVSLSSWLRYYHVSNADLHPPNLGINNLLVGVGINFFF